MSGPSRRDPHPSLSPQDVIRIQLEALKNNGPEDDGIRIAFRFASPGNKEVTGPVERFIGMVKNPLYLPMLNFESAQFGPLIVAGAHAQQRVTLVTRDGKRVVYEFTLSRQDEPPFQGCWMTDGVAREDEPQDLVRIRPEQLN